MPAGAVGTLAGVEITPTLGLVDAEQSLLKPCLQLFGHLPHQ
jgi:hypothetical protein